MGRLQIIEITADRLEEVDRIPSRLEVRSQFQVQPVDGGLGGMTLVEQPVAQPYIKDYDSYGEIPSDWAKKFDVSRWGFFLALDGEKKVGAAALALATTGVFMLEDRSDLALLWDIRVLQQARGAGIPLFRHAAAWAAGRGAAQMKIETQNVNVPACRFYAKMGAVLGEIRRYGYASVPAVAQEVMLCWYLDLPQRV